MINQVALNQELAENSYLNGSICATKEDYKVCKELGSVDATVFPHLVRWQTHVSHLADKFPNFGPFGEAVPEGKKSSGASEPAVAAATAAAGANSGAAFSASAAGGVKADASAKSTRKTDKRTKAVGSAASAPVPVVAVPSAASLAPACILPASTKLQTADGHGFSVLSYNVLLPNSQDGWWLYKYYRAPKPEFTEWPARQQLLRDQLLTAAADIMCLQECSDLSFDEDWKFLAEAGYEPLLHNKTGRMRPATFWKADAWELVAAQHRDRTLVTLLQRKTGPDAGKQLFVINCHLSAGPQADRRMRQVHEALEQAAKEAKKQSLQKYSMVVCGDFNSQGQTAVRELLQSGEVGPDFREAGDPTEKGQEGKQITSKVKKQTCGCFVNAFEAAFGVEKVPATILAANIDSKMMTYDNKPTPELLAAVNASFDKFRSGGKEFLEQSAVEAWLLKINKKIGRGSEYRFAMAAMEKRGGQELYREDFVALYVAELEEGKFWGVEHDLREMLEKDTGLAVPSDGPCQLCFDYIYFAKEGLQLKAVQEPLTPDRKDIIFSAPYEVLPNKWHPSDHLPVAAIFDFL